MNIIVTGAGGVIGTDLLRELREAHTILAVTRSSPKVRQGGVQYVNVDLLSIDTETFLNQYNNKDFDIIVHAAGQAHIRQTAENRELFLKNNVTATTQALKLAQKANVRKFILLSTVAVLACDEDDVYADTKKEAEQLVVKFCQDNKMEYCIIRPAVVYGENDIKGNVYKLIKQMSLGFFPLLNGGKTIKSMIYVRNLSYIVRCIVESPAYDNEVLIACDQERYSVKQICNIIQTKVERRVILLSLPNCMLNLAICGLKIIQGVGGGTGINIASIKKLSVDTYFKLSETNNKLVSNIPYSTQEGLANTVKWLRNNGLLG